MRRSAIRHLKKAALLVLLVACEVGCGLAPERVSADDPRVVQLMTSLREIDRAAMGFTAIDPNAQLRLETRPRAGYDAMLHVDGQPHRTIAFRRSGQSYKWIHEQETFEGPNEYDSADGRFREEIIITFETEHVSGVPLNRVHIAYWGDDPRLTEADTRQELSLEIVRPILKQWGYVQ